MYFICSSNIPNFPFIVLIFSIFQLLFLLNLKNEVMSNSIVNELMEASFIANLKKINWLMSLDPTILSANLPIVDVHSMDSEHGRTPLLICGSDPQNNNVSIVDKDCKNIAILLNERGANLSHIDNYGWNGVALGAIRGHVKFCKYLIDNGVNADLPDNKGRTPIIKVSAHGYFDLFKLLFDNGANLTRKDQSGLTALHYATRLALNNISYVPFLENIFSYLHLKSYNIDNAIDKNNRTVLMYSAINNNYEISKILIKYGSDPKLKDRYGVSVLSMPSDINIINMFMDKIISLTEESHKKWIESDVYKDDL